MTAVANRLPAHAACQQGVPEASRTPKRLPNENLCDRDCYDSSHGLVSVNGWCQLGLLLKQALPEATACLRLQQRLVQGWISSVYM
jgi:hypothetical protein